MPNPLGKVRKLRFDETEMAYFEEEQIVLLLDHLARLEDDTLLISEVCLSTGARWGEAEGLKPRQIRKRLVQYNRTKSSRNRTIPISEALESRLVKALPFKPSYDNFRRAVKALKFDLPAGQLTHVLRHTFASHYMMNGGDIITLQKVMGHATLAMTQKYAHFSPGHMAEVVALNPLAKTLRMTDCSGGSV
ncbi:Tyrosine recombinase XerD [compost metagenome]